MMMMMMMAHMDGIMGDGRWLHAVAGFDPEQFDHPRQMAGQRVVSSGRARPSWDDGAEAPQPGNRRRLRMRHFLLLPLARRKDGRPEDGQGPYC